MAQTVVVGVTGSIAAFRAADVCSSLRKDGVDVRSEVGDDQTRRLRLLVEDRVRRRHQVLTSERKPADQGLVDDHRVVGHAQGPLQDLGPLGRGVDEALGLEVRADDRLSRQSPGRQLSCR